MSDFLKRLANVDPNGRICKDCGHSAITHHLKMIKLDGKMEELSFKETRQGCRSCECNQFK